MRPYKTILYILLLTSLTGRAEVTYPPAVDSLIHILHTTTGPEVLAIYPELDNALYETGDMELHLDFNRRFIEAARREKDKLMESYAHILTITTLYNYRAPDSLLLAESFKALNFIKDVSGAEDYYFHAASTITDTYMVLGKYEEVLKYAEQFYAEAQKLHNSSGVVMALQTIATAYGELELPDKAETLYRESIAAADENTDAGLLVHSYSLLARMLNNQNRYEEALEAAKAFEAYLEQIDAHNSILKMHYFSLYLDYAASYTQAGQYGQAQAYIARAAEMPVAESNMGIYLLEDARFHLLFKEGNYTEALQALNRMEEGLDEGIYSYQSYLLIKKNRGEVYYLSGIYDQAAQTYKEYIAQNDSLQKVEVTNKLHAMRTRYEVDKLEMQQEQERRYFRSTITWLSIVLVLSGILIIIVLLTARRLRAKNRILVEKAKQWAEATAPLSSPLRNPTPGEEDKEVAEKLDLYINETKIYKDPALTLDSLADQLGLTRNRLSRAINRTAARNFKQYINEFRIRETIILMDDPAFRHRSLDELMELAGFNSRSAFYESFKKITGLTPSQYWKERR